MRQRLTLAFLFAASPLLWAQGFVNFVVPTHPLMVLTGAPYCADTVNERRQTLMDGTHIIQTYNIDHVCRDSAGRTRTERSPFASARDRAGSPSAGMKIVEIRDPVGGFLYVLDVQNGVAHRAKIPTETISRPPRVRREGNYIATLTPGSGESANPSRPQYTQETLGTNTIEGVQVEGTLHKTVYPVGSEGNDRPIIVTDEIWTAPELQLLVKTVRSDPRTGEQLHRLDNLTTAEPELSLFQVPAGYRMVDETGNFKIEYPGR